MTDEEFLDQQMKALGCAAQNPLSDECRHLRSCRDRLQKCEAHRRECEAHHRECEANDREWMTVITVNRGVNSMQPQRSNMIFVGKAHGWTPAARLAFVLARPRGGGATNRPAGVYKVRVNKQGAELGQAEHMFFAGSTGDPVPGWASLDLDGLVQDDGQAWCIYLAATGQGNQSGNGFCDDVTVLSPRRSEILVKTTWP